MQQMATQCKKGVTTVGKSDIVRERIKSILVAKPGIKQAEVAQELDLTAHTISKHVKDIRAEWEANE
jgi:predicted transcriptional regulator